jgi:tetratricopeptide (TPR) repeat protein
MFQRFVKRRKQQAVLKQFLQALETEPTNPQIWSNLGYLYIEIRKLDKAQLCADRLKAIDAKHAELLQFAIEHPELRSRGVADLFGLK